MYVPAAIDVVVLVCEPCDWVLSSVCTLLADVEAVAVVQSIVRILSPLSNQRLCNAKKMKPCLSLYPKSPVHAKVDAT